MRAWDKQHRSPGAHLRPGCAGAQISERGGGGGPIHETPEGHPHLKPPRASGAEASCSTHRPKTSESSAAGRPCPPKRLKPRAAGSASQAQGRWLSRLRARQAQGQLAARFPSTKPLSSFLNPRQLNPPPARKSTHTRPKLRLLDPLLAQDPRTKLRDWLINCLIACQGPHQQRLPNTCLQSPAGPTSSLRQRQNTQQRGDAGLEETAG